MCLALERLTHIDHLHNYRYIGLGSPYFVDFILFHKNLGILDLVSIEKEVSKKARFEFNIPFSGIKMHYGHSKTVLPNLQLNQVKNILWLDYDEKITDYMFSDIDTFFGNTMPGSFFVISVNVEEEYLDQTHSDGEKKITRQEFRMNKLINRVGKSRLPMEFVDLNLNTKNLTMVTYEMINRQIKTSLINRNGDKKDKILYKQYFNFLYKDNATILTVGGMIYDRSIKTLVEKMDLENLSFVQSGVDSYKIQCPNLTLREIKALDKVLPDELELVRGKFKNKKFHAIPLIQNDIMNYAKIYRYYPNYTEANL